MPAVVLLSYSGALGGAERVLLDFASSLQGERWLACPDGPLARAACESGLRVRPIRSLRLDLRASARDRILAAGRLAEHAREARGVLRDLDPELVIACGTRTALALLLARPPAAPVIFMHNELLPGPRIAALVRRAAGRASLVIVPSRVVADDLALRRAPTIVHPGVETDAFANLGEPVQPPEVLVLGAIAPVKRPDLALEICALARRRRPDLRLRFVGAPLSSGPLPEQLRERARRPDLAGSVQFAGEVANPAPDLGRASCLLHCCETESFGLAVAEAMAAARPVIVPAAGGTAEVADASCGVLYPLRDAAAAADAIVELLGDPEHARELGEHGRSRVRERFARERTRRALAAAAAPLLGPAGPQRRGRGTSRAPLPRDGLALLTVTHNSAPELGGLLDSVARHLPGTRTVVVDSASEDDSVAVARACPSAFSIALEQNVGFGRACNRGLAEIAEPVCALVNPDVELIDGSLADLAAEAARRDRPPRLLAPLVLWPDGKRQDTVHPRPGSPAELIVSVLPPALVPGAAPWRADAPRSVGWAVGCAVVGPTETLRRLGPFDPSIFMYGEDLELGLRAAQAGVQTWFWPAARVLHHGAHATTAAFGGEPFERLARARHDVVRRRLGSRSAVLDDLAQALTFAMRIVAKRALGRSAAREQRQLLALRSVNRPR